MTAKFKELNPEAMACKNGDLIQKPHWQLREEAETREAWNKMTPEEQEELKRVQHEEYLQS